MRERTSKKVKDEVLAQARWFGRRGKGGEKARSKLRRQKKRAFALQTPSRKDLMDGVCNRKSSLCFFPGDASQESEKMNFSPDA